MVELLPRDAAWVKSSAAASLSGWGGRPLPVVVARLEPSAVIKVAALGIEARQVKVILSLTDAGTASGALGHGFRVIARIKRSESNESLAQVLARLQTGDRVILHRNDHLSATQ